jgi:hypothetical protein
MSIKSIGELGTKLAAIINRRKLRRNTDAFGSVRRLLVAAKVVPRWPILVTLMMETIRSYETSVLTRTKRRNILEVAILHSHRRENVKSYGDSFTFYM